MTMLEHILSTRAYWAGQWVDLWSIPHTLFGVMVAFIAVLIGVRLVIAFGAAAALAAFWEVFERVSGVGHTEAPTNSLMDMVLALIGFGLGVLILRRIKSEDGRRVFIAIVAVIWGLSNFLGWLAYTHYGAP